MNRMPIVVSLFEVFDCIDNFHYYTVHLWFKKRQIISTKLHAKGNREVF